LKKNQKKNIKGATAVEYGMLVVGVSIALMALIFSMGDSLLIVFQKLVTTFSSVDG